MVGEEGQVGLQLARRRDEAQLASRSRAAVCIPRTGRRINCRSICFPQVLDAMLGCRHVRTAYFLRNHGCVFTAMQSQGRCRVTPSEVPSPPPLLKRSFLPICHGRRAPSCTTERLHRALGGLRDAGVRGRGSCLDGIHSFKYGQESVRIGHFLR
ncbi:unnamed protein product [Scytosiphon promiscuus]